MKICFLIALKTFFVIAEKEINIGEFFTTNQNKSLNMYDLPVIERHNR